MLRRVQGAGRSANTAACWLLLPLILVYMLLPPKTTFGNLTVLSDQHKRGSWPSDLCSSLSSLDDDGSQPLAAAPAPPFSDFPTHPSLKNPKDGLNYEFSAFRKHKEYGEIYSSFTSNDDDFQEGRDKRRSLFDDNNGDTFAAYNPDFDYRSALKQTKSKGNNNNNNNMDDEFMRSFIYSDEKKASQKMMKSPVEAKGNAAAFASSSPPPPLAAAAAASSSLNNLNEFWKEISQDPEKAKWFSSSPINLEKFREVDLPIMDGWINDSLAKQYPNWRERIQEDKLDRILMATCPYNETIRNPPHKGIVTTLAGKPGLFGCVDGYRNVALFHRPMGIAIDFKGNVYVADAYNNAIRKISPGQMVTTLAGKAGEMGKQDGFGSNARFGEMMGPIGLSLDTSNRYLIAADGDNHNIRRVDVLTGEVTTIAGTGKAHDKDGASGVSGCHHPMGVAVDQDDNILVADTQNSRIRRINTNGMIDYYSGYEMMGELWPDVIYILSERDKLTNLDGNNNNSIYHFPGGIAHSKYSGNIYVADTDGYQIRKIATDGVVTTVVGPGDLDGWQSGMVDAIGRKAYIGHVIGMSVGPDDVLYFADGDNHRIRKMTPSREVTTVAGKGTHDFVFNPGAGFLDGSTGIATFNMPQAVVCDDFGNLYVADTLNHLIRKISPMDSREHEIFYNATVGDVATFENDTGTYIARTPKPTLMPTQRLVFNEKEAAGDNLLDLLDKMKEDLGKRMDEDDIDENL